MVTATYTCDEGYVLKGSETRECVGGVWQPEAPSCKGKSVTPFYASNIKLIQMHPLKMYRKTFTVINVLFIRKANKRDNVLGYDANTIISVETKLGEKITHHTQYRLHKYGSICVTWTLAQFTSCTCFTDSVIVTFSRHNKECNVFLSILPPFVFNTTHLTHYHMLTAS